MHILRILTYIPGKLLKAIACTKELFFDAGFKLGKIDAALSSFRHAGECFGACASLLFVINSYPLMEIS